MGKANGSRALLPRAFRALEAICETLLPPGGAIAPGAKDVDLAAKVDAYLAACEPTTRAEVQGAILALEAAPFGSRYFDFFTRLTSRERTEFLTAAEHSPLLTTRALVMLLKYMIGNSYCSIPEVGKAIGVDGRHCMVDDPPRSAPRLHPRSYPEVSRDCVEQCDVVIVGSGAGGATVAKECAEAGLSVLVIEEGDYFTRDDFEGPVWERFRRFYRGNGTTAAAGRPIIAVPLGKTVGGTTTVNSGTCFRTPDRVLDNWGKECGVQGADPASMKPFFDRVEEICHVEPAPRHLLGENALRFEVGAKALGYSCGPIPRGIIGCRGCGECAYGCPSDAKQSTNISYLPLAEAAGAVIYCRTRVEQIVEEVGQATGVVARLLDESGKPQAKLTVHARAVVAAAGAPMTPLLLKQSRLALGSGQVGKNLRMHPAAGIGAVFDEPVFPWRGTLQPFMVDEFSESDEIMLEVTSSYPGVSSGIMPGVGHAYKEALSRYRYLASCGLMVSDTSKGTVHRGIGGPLISYSLNRNDADRTAKGMGIIAEIFLAAGAKEVLTGLPGFPTVKSQADLQALREARFSPGVFKLMAFHPMGTARMGSDPQTSVVDSWGEAHEVPGLYVADGSVFPTCTGVNPQISIMAFATRTASRIVERLGGVPRS